MKIVAGVDWSDEAFAAVEQIGLLYKPEEVSLVHGVDMGVFQYPIVAQAANLQGYDEFRQALLAAGREATARCRTLLPETIPSVRTLCEMHNPASFILDTANATNADLIVVGTHDHSRVTEVFSGSISHRVLLHATRPTLVVKGKAKPVSRILLAIEGHDDGVRLQRWLRAHPFAHPVAVTVLSVVPALNLVDPQLVVGFQTWSEDATRHAEKIVHDTAQALAGSQFTTAEAVRVGDPVSSVCEAATGHDVIVVGSHGRKGVDRFLLGSVSHGIVHRATCSVLVVR